jgi:hypothetical protein
MPPDVERARGELEHAREMSERLWAEYRAYCETLNPQPAVATPEQLRRMQEASDWTGRIYAAEQALFVAENGGPGVVGSHGSYQWLSMYERDISELMRLCPEVVLGKYLAVTSIDSGALKLTDEEMNAGWRTADEGRFYRAASWSGHEYRDA